MDALDDGPDSNTEITDGVGAWCGARHIVKVVVQAGAVAGI
eukprot:COSAG02_NODE_1514_length_12189_cov_15.403060_7_plen_41_part_00